MSFKWALESCGPVDLHDCFTDPSYFGRFCKSYMASVHQGISVWNFLQVFSAGLK